MCCSFWRCKQVKDQEIHSFILKCQEIHHGIQVFFFKLLLKFFKFIIYPSYARHKANGYKEHFFLWVWYCSSLRQWRIRKWQWRKYAEVDETMQSQTYGAQQSIVTMVVMVMLHNFHPRHVCQNTVTVTVGHFSCAWIPCMRMIFVC